VWYLTKIDSVVEVEPTMNSPGRCTNAVYAQKLIHFAHMKISQLDIKT